MVTFSTIDQTLDTTVENCKNSSGLEKIPQKSPQPFKKPEPELHKALKPVEFITVLQMESRELNLPELKEEKEEVPIIPDLKKAEEDYNSIDYQIIAANLWKSKAKELF